MPTIEVNGEKLAYVEEGEGVPVVLLHGAGAHAGLSSEMTAALGPGFKIHAFSLRGHGGSTCNGGLSAQGISKDVYAAMQTLGIPPCHLVGVSLGAAAALLLAAEVPEHVRSLTVSGIGLGPSKPLADEIYGVREAVHYLKPDDFALQVGEALLAPDAPRDRLSRIEQSLLTLTKQRYLQALEALAAADVKTAIGKIKSPTLVLHGELDGIIDVAEAEALAQALGAGECVEVPDAAHLADIDNPTAFASQLRAHFGKTT